MQSMKFDFSLGVHLTEVQGQHVPQPLIRFCIRGAHNRQTLNDTPNAGSVILHILGFMLF